jgi:hypothetical protein
MKRDAACYTGCVNAMLLRLRDYLSPLVILRFAQNLVQQHPKQHFFFSNRVPEEKGNIQVEDEILRSE